MKKGLAELIAEIKKAEIFEKNKQINYDFNYPISQTIILNDLPASSDSDSPGFFLPMPKSIFIFDYLIDLQTYHKVSHLIQLYLERFNITLHWFLQLLRK